MSIFNINLSSELKPSAVILLHALLGRGDMLEKVGQVFCGYDLGEGFAEVKRLTPTWQIDSQARFNFINS